MLKDIPGFVGKFAAYFTAAVAIKDSLDEKMDGLNQEAKKRDVPGELMMQKRRGKEKAEATVDFDFLHGGHPLRISASLNRQRLPGAPFAQQPAQQVPINITNCR
jgi:hypothetical protein